MFWVGDSQWGWCKNLKKLPNEFISGIADNIPICCVGTYLLCILFSLITKEDGVVFEFIYRDYNDFLKTDYWRCPICKARKKTNKIRWESEELEYFLECKRKLR